MEVLEDTLQTTKCLMRVTTDKLIFTGMSNGVLEIYSYTGVYSGEEGNQGDELAVIFFCFLHALAQNVCMHNPQLLKPSTQSKMTAKLSASAICISTR